MAVLSGERLHENMERLLPGARTAALLWQGAALAGGVLLGAGRVYGGAAPFGLALVIGCPPAYCLAAAVGTLAAGVVLQPALLGIKVGVAAVAAATVRRLIDGRPRAGALAGCLTLAAAQLVQILLLGGFVNFSQTAAVGCTALLAAGLGWAFASFPVREPRGVCLWLAVGAACLQRCAVGPLAPGLALASAAGLCAAIGGTLEQTAVLSIALAAALTAAGPERAFAALAVAMGSLAASCLCPGERGRCAGVFAVGCTLGALAAPDAVSVVPLAVSAGVGVTAALALPGSVMRRIFPPPAPPVQAQGLSGAARKLSAVADTLSDIADTVNAVCQRQMPPKGESFDFVVEQVARTTCQSCTRRSRCWVRGYATAMDGLQHLKPVLESKGRVEVQDLPGQLSVCIHPADLCTAANHGYRLWRSRRQTRARASMLRTALTEQYSALAGALAQLAAKLGQAGLPDPRREAKLAQLFAELGLDALECSVTADLAGRLTASVTICRTHFTQEEISGLVEEVSRLCRRDMDLPEITHCRTVTMLTFGEKPLFTAEFGAAGHAAAGQSVSGDALDQFCDTSGRAQMLLCDGMGTGRAAAVDGQMAAKLTAQLLRAGFAAESAARLVNVALGLKGAEQEAGATLDLLTVDLYTGRAGLFKAGAAPSFLVRGGVPRMLDGASLPMGTLDSLVGRSTTFALDAGDWVVLVSDGALADGADWLMQQLQLCARLGHTPKQAAETVADAAARRAGDKRDDITVAVLAVGKVG
ncbi:SpoIIE family protein phosphatase [Gemmiger formicilis]|uniref:SpoIIE family protein phosphatase n=1 Tax=Gemmiger formicilis TaxID=745368 RepID=UPI00210EE6C9|nr:SpoIIE family protein phosphatase [Gemmiger formicilis]MCQ5079812.1 SpoIIE family protein phosphatase [Gemmiger formicilis]MCQ5115586.1 SpoIIE family protein phosphatase [Gemmiger formicilis]